MKTESQRLLEEYLGGRLSAEEVRSAEQWLARGDAGAGRGEQLAVYTFLREMGPTQAPATVVRRTCERLRVEAARRHVPDTRQSSLRAIGSALSWTYRGPALAVAVPWGSSARRYSAQGLATSRFALGPLGLMPSAPGRPSRSKPRSSVWKRLLVAVSLP
jgi:hypothetical protein